MKILLNITHGFQARMLLRSKISEHLLAAGCELIVVSPNAGEEYFRREFDHPQICLEPMPTQSSRVEAYLISLRQYLLMNPALGATLNHKNERFKSSSPKLYYFCRAINKVIGRWSIFRKTFLALESWWFSGKDFDPLLKKHAPDLVVAGTPGYAQDDVHLLRAAKRLGISSTTVMLSWDNLTSKGYMGAQPDELLVWSQMMAHEAVELHHFPPAHTYWTGAAQFDHLAGFRETFDRDQWRRSQGVPENAKLLMFGTINPGVMPQQVILLRELAAAVEKNQFAQPCYLWIRLHPQVVQGYWKQDIESYLALAGPSVKVEVPPVRDSKLSWDLPPEDQRHLASLLSASDVMISPGSTLFIEGACVDVPMISTFYDGPENRTDGFTAARFKYYTHYAKMNVSGGISEAFSQDELIQQANRYLVDPALHRAERAEIVRLELGELDGNAARRTADYLLRFASLETAKQSSQSS
jgi:hypothetical protein